MNFTGQDLRGQVFYSRDFQGAVFDGAKGYPR